MTAKEIDALEMAILKAEKDAQKYANTEDGGTCNFDATAAPQATETPQISTETAKVENVSAEEQTTAETANMELYNAKYYFDKYNGDSHAAAQFYNEAMDAVRDELFEYRMAPRKGGKFRSERIAELNRKLDALQTECAQVCRAIQWYVRRNTPQPPETPPAKELPTDTGKVAQTANKPHNPTIKKSLNIRNLRTTDRVLEDVSFIIREKASIPSVLQCASASPP